MSELNCAVVSDLLPLYVEDIVSPETKQAIAQHLDTCSDCRAKYEQMLMDVPIETELNKEAAVPLKKFRFHLLLNIISFPLWLPLLAAGAAIMLTLYLCVWVVAVCFWCVPVSFGAVSLAGIWGAGIGFIQGGAANGMMCLAIAAAAAGLSIFLFYPCLLFSRFIIKLTVSLWKRMIRRWRDK